MDIKSLLKVVAERFLIRTMIVHLCLRLCLMSYALCLMSYLFECRNWNSFKYYQDVKFKNC